MRIDRAALPFVAIASLPVWIAAWFGAAVAAAVLVVVPIGVALFFRDPDREPPGDPLAVLSPADGEVRHAGVARAGGPPGEWLQVIIFLSPLDVHINRAPVEGRVTRIDYVAGAFSPAYAHDADRNERSEIWIDHDGVAIVARQIVGTLARRVVCRVKVGQQVEAGGRIGLMKFGSRMDVFVPPDATLLVKPGDRVRGAETVIARLQPGLEA